MLSEAVTAVLYAHIGRNLTADGICFPEGLHERGLWLADGIVYPLAAAGLVNEAGEFNQRCAQLLVSAARNEISDTQFRAGYDRLASDMETVLKRHIAPRRRWRFW